MARDGAPVTSNALASAARWSDADLLAISATCSGNALRDWAQTVRERGGDVAVQRVLDGLPDAYGEIPEAPRTADRIRVAAQIRISERIADVLFGGDLLALRQAIAADVRARVPRAGRLALRALGVRRMMRHTAKVHASLYDAGEARAEVSKREAWIEIRGARFVAHPTWRLMQLLATELAIELGRGRAARQITGYALAGGAFGIEAAW